MLSNLLKNRTDFVFNITILIFLNLLIKPFWILGIDVAVQNEVGEGSYGLYFSILGFTYIFNAILDMGINNFNNRNIARNPQLLSKHFSGIITLKLLLAIGYFAVVFITAICIGYNAYQFKLLFWLAFNQFLNTLILYLRTNISALLYFKTDSVLSVLDKLLMIIFCSILLWTDILGENSFTIDHFIYAQTAAYIFTALVAFGIVISHTHFCKLQWNPVFFIAILKKSFPFALLTLLMAFYNRIDSVMIERLLPETTGAKEAGIYASAFRLLDALAMISYLFSMILLPLFSKMLKKREDINPIIKNAFSLLFVFSISASTILLWYKMPILDFFYTDHVAESAAVFCILIPCIIPISLTYIFGTLLTANGNMRILNWSAFAGMLVNLIVNFILIPHLHARGAAIASLSTQSLMALIQTIIAFRILKIPFKTLPLLRCFLFAIILVPAIGLMAQQFTGGAQYGLILSSLIALGLALSLQLIPLKINQ